MDIVQRLESAVRPDLEVPKPEATEPFRVKGWASRRGERALIYKIPNKSGGRPYEKGVTETELRRAYEELCRTGEFTRSWFDANLSACAKEGGCNFTTIGGLFNLIGEARYAERGTYSKI